MSKRVAILISGSGSNMVSLAQAMNAPDFGATAELVLSNRPDAGGIDKAKAMGIPTETVDHKQFKGDREAFENILENHLNEHKIDVICLAGFMRILTPSFISKWAGKMINIHPSLLPKYKGLDTHQRAIDAGDAEAGCSVHLVTATLDDGPVLAQTNVPILADDTAATLAARVLVQEHILYPATLKRFIEGL